METVKLTQSYVQSLKPDGKPHWIRDAVENKLVLYLGKSGDLRLEHLLYAFAF